MTGRVALLAFAVVGLASGSAARAEPLAFGAVNGSDDFSNHTDVGQCLATTPDGQNSARRCVLKRSSFGGMPVSSATMTLNPAGKVRSLAIVLEGQDFDLARHLLVGRYGTPATAEPFPRWTGFDDGASIAIRKSRLNAIVSFDFPANAVAASPAIPDGALALLLLAGLGAIAGGFAYRAYGAKQARPARAPQPSMRATLERRLREGRDLQF